MPPTVDELILHLLSIDNLGLMPYRRRIVSVSESFCDLWIFHLQIPDVNSWPAHTYHAMRPAVDRGIDSSADALHRRINPVRPYFFRWRLDHVSPDPTLNRIWNTYKDEFAKTRTRELSIID